MGDDVPDAAADAEVREVRARALRVRWPDPTVRPVVDRSAPDDVLLRVELSVCGPDDLTGFIRTVRADLDAAARGGRALLGIRCIGPGPGDPRRRARRAPALAGVYSTISTMTNAPEGPAVRGTWVELWSQDVAPRGVAVTSDACPAGVDRLAP